jgi:hypothetical protein
MPDETITLVLNGKVFIEDFAVAISGWLELVKGIGSELNSSEAVRWELEDTAAGSFTGTMRAVYQRIPDQKMAKEFVERYTRVGRDLRQRKLSAFSPSLKRGAEKIISVIGERVTSVRFETDIDDAEVFAKPIADENTPLESADAPKSDKFVIERRDYRRNSRGSLRGKVQSIMSRGALRFTLYDAVSDHAVSCYVLPGKEEMMRDAWGKLALVEGIVRRDAATGDVTSIRNVDRITVLASEGTGGWREALRCSPSRPGKISPEAAVRRLRDAE